MNPRPTATLSLSLALAFTPIVTGVAVGAGQRAAPVTPEAALQQLIDGNQRFIARKPMHPEDHKLQREDLLEGQEPIAAVLSCSDSRVPPDTIFDQGLGMLFIVRVAGNTIDLMGLQSLEYAIVQLHAPLIMVMGHDSCGAVKAAITAYPKLGVGPMLSNIYEAIATTRGEAGDPVSNAINANVMNQVKLLGGYMPFAQRIKAGQLKIVGARYSLESGKVNFLTK
jgi:carbonic anhydrase